MLFDKFGSVIGSTQKEHSQIFPRSGWVEHDPTEIWDCTQQVIRQTLSQTQVAVTDIKSIGITNQRETTVVWDRQTGTPVHNAIVWQDLRTDSICKDLVASGHGETITFKTGLPVATYFSGPKIRWILDNSESDLDNGNLLFGTIDTWLLWKLTGGESHVTDPTNASRTMLMNLETLDWDDELLEILQVPRSMLPRIQPSSDPKSHETTCIDGPFESAIPITGILGDQQAATVGQTCFNPGEAKNTYGTGCFMILNTGEELVRSKNGLLTTVCFQNWCNSCNTNWKKKPWAAK
jgi:glycerol kinase